MSLMLAGTLLVCSGCGTASQQAAEIERSDGTETAGSGENTAGGETADSGENTDSVQTAGTMDESESAETDGKYEKVRPEETVTLDVYSQLSGYAGEQQGWFAKEMLDRFNVKLNFINDGSEDFYERMAAEGDLGDIIIFGTDTDQYHSAIDNGLLLDWESNGLLEEYGSYMKEHMTKALEKNKKNSGGHIYGFGNDVAAESGEYGDFDYHPDVRWDLYQQAGAPEIVELEDYVDVLKKMKDIAPTSDSGEETYGVSLFADWDGDMMMFAKSTCTNFFGVDELGIGLYEAATGTFQGALQEDGYYIRALHFYNELYRNDLLDPDSKEQGYEGCIEDYKDGRAFFCIFGWLAAPQYNTVQHTADGKMMLPLAAKNQNTLVYGLNENGSNRVWTIGSKTEHPELVMSIMNWLCTPEGRLVSEYGPKGVGWDYDLEKNTCILELGYKAKSGEDIELPESSGYEGKWVDGIPQFNNTTWILNTKNTESNGQTFNYQYWPNVLSLPVSDIEEQWRKANEADSAREYLSKFQYTVSKPNTYTSSNKSEELGEEWANVTACIRDGSWDAVYAETEEEFWQIVEEMCRKADECGYADCVAWCEAEAAARKASEE